jgi:hypothetical protein
VGLSRQRAVGPPQFGTEYDCVGNQIVALEDLAIPVMLNPGGAQTGKTVFVDRSLPIQKLVNAERVSLARFFEA